MLFAFISIYTNIISRGRNSLGCAQDGFFFSQSCFSICLYPNSFTSLTGVSISKKYSCPHIPQVKTNLSVILPLQNYKPNYVLILVMRRPTHNNFARMITGRNITMKKINEINARIDNPTKNDKELRDLLGADNMDFMNLQQGAKHRKYNHDPIVGLANAMAIDPDHGFEVFMAHEMMDYLSNSIRDSLGTDSRDITEVILNRYLKSTNSNLPKVYKKKYKNPFFNGPPAKPNPLKAIQRKNRFYKAKIRKTNQLHNIWD